MWMEWIVVDVCEWDVECVDVGDGELSVEW